VSTNASRSSGPSTPSPPTSPPFTADYAQMYVLSFCGPSSLP
jgi:hypothetical protein